MKTDDRFRRAAKLEAPKGQCRGCGSVVPAGRRTWCSDACVAENLVKLSPGEARAQVFKRDAGVCSQCGFDTEQAKRIFDRLSGKDGFAVYQNRDVLLFLLNHWRPRKLPYSSTSDVLRLPHLWEADHIVPVVEGGGSCSLDGLRTLCVRCHYARPKARKRAS